MCMADTRTKPSEMPAEARHRSTSSVMSMISWRFFVVNSPEVNAFALPGGFVYVNRGLIERTSNMDELAGVLGHEIGHVVRRHSIKQMEKEQGANVGITLACVLTNICNSQAAGALINVGGTAVFARFSRQDEAEADQEAGDGGRHGRGELRLPHRPRGRDSID